MALLDRLRDGTCTQGEIAAIAADVLVNPPPLIAAARRVLESIGTELESMAAVELLALLVEGGPDVEAHSARTPGRKHDTRARTTTE